MSSIEGGFDQKSLEITEKLVRKASVDPRVDIDELGDALAMLESEKERAINLNKRDQGFKTRDTEIAINTFRQISADKEGNIRHVAVLAYLKQQHQFALERQTKPSVLQTATRQLSESTRAVAVGTTTRLTRRGFLREVAITTGAAALTVIGINRLEDSNESLQRTFASINQQCATEYVPQAKALAIAQGHEVTAEDEQKTVEVCNDVLQRRILDDDKILDPERLRRLGNTTVLLAGGFGVLTQLYRGGAEVISRIANSRIISSLRGASI